MYSNCIPLDTTRSGDLNKVGGKAANLIRLLEGGFPVPRGFVVTVDAYLDFIGSNGLDGKIADLLQDADLNDKNALKMCSDAIREMITAPAIGKGIVDEIEGLIRESADGTVWAIRSSAVAEDLPEASFAGQQDTFLNVDDKSVLGAIKRCWASYWNERAMSYRHYAGISHTEGGVAVIVQRMVDSDVSGVMFTRDPVDKNGKRAIIESSWGLGESIVSGLVTPDRFVIDLESRSIVEKKINRKERGIFLSDSGNEAVTIDRGRQESSSLSEEQIMELLDFGRRIEDHFDGPQDIEWSIEDGSILLLQSRPITTLGDGGDILWTRAYGDEYWADATSPLFFSFLGHYLTRYVNDEGSEIMGYKELTDLKLLKLHKGHIYFNSKVLEEVFTFNPRFSRTKELLNYFPIKDQDRIANAKTKTLRRLWAEIRIMLKDPDGSMMKTDKAYREWTENFLAAMEAYDRTDLGKLSFEELKAQYDYMECAFLKHFRLIRYGMVTHSIGTNLMVKRWLVDWLDDSTGELYSKLISGLPDNKTILTNMAIARLADMIRKDEDLTKALIDGGEEEFLETLRGRPQYLHYQGFIDEYGHRSHTREILFPRWSEDQGLVIDILRSLVGSQPIDFEEIEQKNVMERLEVQKLIDERIGKMPMGFFRKRIFNVVLRYAQTYLIFRENQRFYLDHILCRTRRLFLEYGRRFHEEGLTDSIEDVFFLSREEVFSIAAGGSRAALRHIKSRRGEFEKNRYKLPPKFLKGRTEFDDTVMYDKDVVKIIGTSASPGIVTGYARVVESIEQLPSVNDDEILVTSNTDPGWTPIFAKLGGLITETGGILSHGAVVSREYGIPAVTAVKNATSFFKNGQKITLDGNEGVIYLEE
ncbi:MAG TPA: PEP/pyruvate-binding domain-containing protein [Candidatus Methanofastidiosa archaeon]|nr:PEP/pyruvate-binding domain-containing protein [Candidatus Methanofastidiosa archaeon]